MVRRRLFRGARLRGRLARAAALRLAHRGNQMSRVLLFGIGIDNVTTDQAVEALRRLLDSGKGQHYVVTPNVDHVVRLENDAAFRQAYAGATLVLPDGMPLVWASRVLGKPLKDRV